MMTEEDDDVDDNRWWWWRWPQMVVVLLSLESPRAWPKDRYFFLVSTIVSGKL